MLGRYPELSLKDAREQARRDRAPVERGTDVAAAEQTEKALLLEAPKLQRLGEVCYAKYIRPRCIDARPLQTRQRLSFGRFIGGCKP
jgi:hypothetical protein